jgi:Domain of unknown function (DUF1835)/Protein of unknown function
MAYLHVVNGDHAADLLGEALATAGRTDRVICLRDDLAVGPLEGIDDDADARQSFWHTVLNEPQRDLREDFEAQAGALTELAQARTEVAIWHGYSAADQLTLRRAAYHLRNTPQRINEIGLTLREADPARVGPGGQTAVAMYSADALRARLPTIAPVSVLRISRLALEWQELKRVNSDLRHLANNTFVGSSFCELDDLIVDLATPEWQPVNRLAGAVMRTDAGFLVTDVLAFWRIRHLTEAGQLKARHTGSTQEIALTQHATTPYSPAHKEM